MDRYEGLNEAVHISGFVTRDHYNSHQVTTNLTRYEFNICVYRAQVEILTDENSTKNIPVGRIFYRSITLLKFRQFEI